MKTICVLGVDYLDLAARTYIAESETRVVGVDVAPINVRPSRRRHPKHSVIHPDLVLGS